MKHVYHPHSSKKKRLKRLYNEALDTLVAEGRVRVTHAQSCPGPAADYSCCDPLLELVVH